MPCGNDNGTDNSWPTAVPLGRLYTAYLAYCNTNGVSKGNVQSLKLFTSQLRAYSPADYFEINSVVKRGQRGSQKREHRVPPLVDWRLHFEQKLQVPRAHADQVLWGLESDTSNSGNQGIPEADGSDNNRGTGSGTGHSDPPHCNLVDLLTPDQMQALVAQGSSAQLGPAPGPQLPVSDAEKEPTKRAGIGGAAEEARAGEGERERLQRARQTEQEELARAQEQAQEAERAFGADGYLGTFGSMVEQIGSLPEHELQSLTTEIFDNATAEPPLQLAIERPPESASDPVQPRNAKRPRPNPPPQSNPEPRALRARTQITSYASLTRRP